MCPAAWKFNEHVRDDTSIPKREPLEPVAALTIRPERSLRNGQEQLKRDRKAGDPKQLQPIVLKFVEPTVAGAVVNDPDLDKKARSAMLDQQVTGVASVHTDLAVVRLGEHGGAVPTRRCGEEFPVKPLLE